MAQKRENWLDLAKGISALFVMLTHISNTPFVYKIFYSYIMLPVFFFASGYLTKNEKPARYLYNRVLKLFILYIMYFVLTFFISLSNLKLLLSRPTAFLQEGLLQLQNLLTGKVLWFISCIIVVSIFFCIIKQVTKNDYLKMFAVSAVMFVLGLVFVKEGRKFWNIDTAVICQFFFVAGYIAKEKAVMDSIKNIGRKLTLSGMAYILLIYGAFFVWGEGAVGITLGTNQWKMLPVTIPALITGNIFILLLTKKIDRLPLLNYIGSHALLYYAFAGHGLSLFKKIFSAIGLTNPYIANLLIVFATAVLMAVLCKCVDRFLPILNGKFKLPVIKQNN